MTPDPTKIIFASSIQTFQNSAIVDQTFSVGSFTFPDGNAQILTFAIPVSNGENVSQVKANFSFDSAKWYIVPMGQSQKLTPSASTNAQIFGNYDGTNLNLRMVIIPVGVAPWSYSAFTLRAIAKIFITPS